MDRFRVKAAQKEWTDKGPDLLRTNTSAVKAMRAVIGPKHEGLFVRRADVPGGGSWGAKLTKGDVMDLFRYWVLHHVQTYCLLSPSVLRGRDIDRHRGFTHGFLLREEFDVGAEHGGEVVVLARATYEDVPLVPLANCTKDTEALHSLVHYQFPLAIHSGGFYYRQIAGSTAWSDHAWGTAIDESQAAAKGFFNDETFDWEARMAQTGNINPDYILGSKDGEVVQCVAPDYRVEPSSAASSHLWHVHTSQVDHDGRRPTRNPMVP